MIEIEAVSEKCNLEEETGIDSSGEFTYHHWIFVWIRLALDIPVVDVPRLGSIQVSTKLLNIELGEHGQAGEVGNPIEFGFGSSFNRGLVVSADSNAQVVKGRGRKRAKSKQQSACDRRGCHCVGLIYEIPSRRECRGDARSSMNESSTSS